MLRVDGLGELHGKADAALQAVERRRVGLTLSSLQRAALALTVDPRTTLLDGRLPACECCFADYLTTNLPDYFARWVRVFPTEFRDRRKIGRLEGCRPTRRRVKPLCGSFTSCGTSLRPSCAITGPSSGHSRSCRASVVDAARLYEHAPARKAPPLDTLHTQKARGRFGSVHGLRLAWGSFDYGECVSVSVPRVSIFTTVVATPRLPSAAVLVTVAVVRLPPASSTMSCTRIISTVSAASVPE